MRGPAFLMAYKSYRIRVMLECGHIESYKVQYPLSVPPEWIPCERCKCEVMVYAFETREWRAKCRDCKYTRWAGQSEMAAEDLKRAHYRSRGHSMSVMYSINPTIFQIIKDHYRRQFFFRIPEQPPNIRFPRKKGDGPDEPPY